MSWEACIGLEIHAQLKTKTKMFSEDSTEFGSKPNTQVHPTSLGLPGALPVINEKAVHFAIKTGLSFNCKIFKTSEFARKNYFYPDLPKGYQISQHNKPICGPGYIEIYHDKKLKKINLTRCHLEEDAGKSYHHKEESLIDLNRAGTPLLEIVSEPEMHTASEAAEYTRSIRRILRTLEVCDGNLEEGSLRCDCNVSVRKKGEKKLGQRVEIKNLNSFRFIEKAIDYEISRQISVLEKNESISQETRLYDSKNNKTLAMRKKEDSQDYKYFPEPDLPPLVLKEEEIEKAKKELPELPLQRALRFEKEFKIPLYDCLVLNDQKQMADYFEKLAKTTGLYKISSNWIMTEVLAYLNEKKLSFEEFPISYEKLARLIKMIDQRLISNKIAKEVFNLVLKQPNKDPEKIVEENNWKMVSDESKINDLVKSILKDHPKQYEAYKKGKVKLFGFFVGKSMERTKGLVCPETLNKILKKNLD